MAVKTRLGIEVGFWQCLLGDVLWYGRILLRHPLAQPARVGARRHPGPIRRPAWTRAVRRAGTAASVLEHDCSGKRRLPAARLLASTR